MGTILPLNGTGDGMIDYPKFPGLAGVYLEDSYVLAIDEAPQQLSFTLLAVLTPEHPAYHAPPPGEHYCYANGKLAFTNASRIEWLRRSSRRYVDAAGDEDLGNIDVLTRSDGAYFVEGDWGEVRIHGADEPLFAIETSPNDDATPKPAQSD